MGDPRLNAVAAGYAAFDAACPLDRCALWVDFTYEEAFGYSPPPLMAPDARHLQAEDPRLTTRYNTQVKVAFQKKQLMACLFTLEAAATTQGWNAKFESQYNQIQAEQLEI